MDSRQEILHTPVALDLGCEIAAPPVVPDTPEEHLRAAVSHWHDAEEQVAITLAALHVAREAVYTALAINASASTLARLVAARHKARAAWRNAVREEADAERVMEKAARWMKEE